MISALKSIICISEFDRPLIKPAELSGESKEIKIFNAFFIISISRKSESAIVSSIAVLSDGSFDEDNMFSDSNLTLRI